MKKILLIGVLFSFSSFASSSQMSESDCQSAGEKYFFEMSTGIIGCNTSSVITIVDKTQLVNGKCEISVSLQEYQTEAQCRDGYQIQFRPLMPIAKIKFNRLCRKHGFKKSKSFKDKYNTKHIVCTEK